MEQERNSCWNRLYNLLTTDRYGNRLYKKFRKWTRDDDSNSSDEGVITFMYCTSLAVVVILSLSIPQSKKEHGERLEERIERRERYEPSNNHNLIPKTPELKPEYQHPGGQK